MGKRIQRMCLALVMIMMVAALFTGCTTQKQTAESSTPEVKATPAPTVTDAPKTTDIDISKSVDLTMYLLGDPPKDYPVMLEELNKHIKQDLNATLKVNWISWGDFGTKYPLLMASGEPFDLIFTANWSFYKDMSQKGAFLAMDDLLPKYAPVSFKDEPKAAWDEARINGKIYMLPWNYREINPHGYVVRGDLRKKYNIPEIKTMDDFGAYLDALAKNEKGMIPYDAGSFDVSILPAMIVYPNGYDKDSLANVGLTYKLGDPGAKVVNLAETQEFADFTKKMRIWYQNGYWSKSVLQNKGQAKDSLTAGKGGAAILNLLQFNELYMLVNASHPDWNLEWFEMANGGKTFASPFLNGGVGIPATSKNPERAMMLLEKLRNDEAYSMLTTYGIKGKNYDLTADNKLTLPAGVKAADNGFPPDGGASWGWRDERFYKIYKDGWPKYEKVRNSIISRVITPELISFTANQDPIKSEIGAITGLGAKYFTPLSVGILDPDKSLVEYRKQLKDAGSERIITEVQKQIDAYLASKK